MPEVNEDQALIITLTPAVEERLDVFNRAQAGELAPLAEYIEDGKPLTREMRLFLGAFLRGELKCKRGPKFNYDKMVKRKFHLKRIRDIMVELSCSKERAIGELAMELNISEDTLVSQIRNAEREEKEEFQIGPSYRGD